MLGSSSGGEVGVLTSLMVINGPPVMTSSVADTGMTLACWSALRHTVVMVTSPLVVMVKTLPEAVS